MNRILYEIIYDNKKKWITGVIRKLKDYDLIIFDCLMDNGVFIFLDLYQALYLEILRIKSRIFVVHLISLVVLSEFYKAFMFLYQVSTVYICFRLKKSINVIIYKPKNCDPDLLKISKTSLLLSLHTSLLQIRQNTNSQSFFRKSNSLNHSVKDIFFM